MSLSAAGIRTASAVALCLSVSVAFAQSDRINLIDGMGNSTCVQFMELHAQNEQISKLIFGNWAQGFLSGVNVERLIEKRKKPYPVPDSAPEAANLLQERCRKVPSANVLDLQLKLVSEFDAKN